MIGRPHIAIGPDVRMVVFRADSRGVGPAAQDLVRPPGAKPNHPGPWEWQVDARAVDASGADLGWVLRRYGWSETPTAAAQAARAAAKDESLLVEPTGRRP